MKHAFFNATIYTGKEKISNKILLTEGNKIKGLVEKDSVPSDTIKIDCQNGVLAPGLIDLQIYGGGGHLFSNEPTKTALKSMIDSLVSNGTTGFLLTLATNSIDVFREAIKIVKQNPHPALLGLHFEGPYLNPVKRGATTHLFNAMSSMHHRDTGLPGAAFLSKTAYASIIADGIHVDYNTLILSKKLMQERLFLITDAVEEVKEGAYIHVKQKDRFTLPDGTLSGSRLTLLEAVKNCVEHAAIPLDESLRMASTYPAQVINRRDLGLIEPGAKANLSIFSNDFKPIFTVLEGNVSE